MKRRLFIGIFLRSPTAFCAYRSVRQRFAPWIQGHWVHPHDLHLTLRFLGNLDELLLPRLRLHLAPYLGRPLPLALHLGEPSLFHGKILYHRIEATRDLLELKAAVDHSLSAVIPCDKRPFIPHVTACRIRTIRNRQRLSVTLKKKKGEKKRVQEYVICHLIETIPCAGKNAPRYRIVD